MFVDTGQTLINNGAGDGTRTRDLLITNQLLYQLSYTSMLTFHCEMDGYFSQISFRSQDKPSKNLNFARSFAIIAQKEVL